MNYTLIAAFSLAVGLASCKGGDRKTTGEKKDTSVKTFESGSFGYDQDFLQQRDSGLVILQSKDGKAQLIVSPKYQAKVFTSTAAGAEGKSFGWVNYKAFDEPVNEHMNAYGGEDRLWLGPEGGKFSLYFKPGAKMVFNDWHTPGVIDTATWNKETETASSVSMRTEATLQNYAGTKLEFRLDRSVNLLDNAAIAAALGIQVTDRLHPVGFSTRNAITNTGTGAWTEATGMPCLWNLDMFRPSEQTVIVIPYQTNASGKIATTDYFGEIPKDRIKMEAGILFFKADGKSRGKLGIPPGRVKDVAGSYDAAGNVLTLVKYDIQPGGKYLNQEWRTDRETFSGDAMNAYNDGPLEDGSQMGPFYEIESVSPAAFLKPGEQLEHNHSVFHFIGDRAELDKIARQVLGVSLDTITGAFK
ncbi:hypothetical protein GCM10027051_26470 [Niabella terrae]